MKRASILSGILFACLVSLYSQENASVEKLRMHLHTLASDSLRGRGFGSKEALAAANYIATQFEKAGIASFNDSYLHPVDFRLGIVNISGNNVLGYIEGSDPALKDEYILVCAHYDHLGWELKEGEEVIYYGADDNASGTAAIMEIGRVLAANREKLGRSVLIAAFDGEENGLVGSKWFIEHAPVPVSKIMGVVNLDMVGMYTAHNGVDLEGIELFAGYTGLVADMAQDYSLAVSKTNSKIEQRTDTAPFGELHIPAVAVTTGMESPYHKPEDQADLIDYEGLGMIADALSGMVISLSGEPEVVAENATWERASTSSAKTFAFGARFNIGSAQQIYIDEFYKGKNVVGADIGLFMRVRLSQVFTLQPEVLLSQKGSQHPEGSFFLDALTIPCNLLITTPDPKNNGVRMYLIAGGYYSHFLRGMIGETKVDFNTTYSPYEYGFNAGFGIEIMNFQGGLYITRGLSGLLQDPAGGMIVSRTVMFTSGWVF